MNALFAVLLLLFGIRFQTAFAIVPHLRLSKVSSRPTFFVKHFQTHSRFCFEYNLSSVHVWRSELFLILRHIRTPVIIIINIAIIIIIIINFASDEESQNKIPTKN